jgi:hypothetical protein
MQVQEVIEARDRQLAKRVADKVMMLKYERYRAAGC